MSEERKKYLMRQKKWIIKSSRSNGAMHFGSCDDSQALIEFKANVMLRSPFKSFY